MAGFDSGLTYGRNVERAIHNLEDMAEFLNTAHPDILTAFKYEMRDELSILKRWLDEGETE